MAYGRCPAVSGKWLDGSTHPVVEKEESGTRDPGGRHRRQPDGSAQEEEQGSTDESRTRWTPVQQPVRKGITAQAAQHAERCEEYEVGQADPDGIPEEEAGQKDQHAAN